jgi:deoxycytidylate deaminase
MNSTIQKKIEQITIDFKSSNQAPNKHFSFLIQKNRILSIGMNSSVTTHPMNRILGYRADLVHSEMDAYLNVRWMNIDFAKCYLVNTRINNFNKFGRSKPCKPCQKLLQKIGIRKVYFTDENGLWQKMYISAI